MSRLFVMVRGVVYALGFVWLWAWCASAVRPLDAELPVSLPVWLRPIGILFVTTGALVAAACIAMFITQGRGTPAPFDPPRDFVAAGPYRYVRNPMYIGAAAVILGAGLLLSSPSIVLLALAFLLLMHLVVILYEEPALARKFGASYDRYRSSVHRWLIRRPSSHA